MCHHADVGGAAPGSVSAVGAYDHFAEGLRIPMIRIGVGGAMLQDVLSLITANSRTSFNMRADLQAQAAACGVGLQRLQLLFEEQGAHQVEAGMEWLLDYADRLTRQEIETIPDGRYSFTDYLDDDGSGPDAKPVPICVTMTVSGSTLHFDFTGTGAQVRTAINNVPYSVVSVVYFMVRTLVGETAPNNDGCYRGVTVQIPEGTILNPRFPAPVAARSASLRRVIDALYGVMALAIPEKMTGANCGQTSLIPIGMHDECGNFVVVSLGGPFVGGMGARADKDGIDCTDHDCSNAFSMPIEVSEAALPILFHRVELWTDSGGAGRSRGGLGYHLDAEWQRGEGLASLRRERQKFAPWGIRGGHPGPLCRTVLASAGQPPRPLTPKCQTTLEPGDHLLLWTTGSGGYGNPAERDVQRVLEDVLDGRVSDEAARSVYGVAIRAGRVDDAATRRLRAELPADINT